MSKKYLLWGWSKRLFPILPPEKQKPQPSVNFDPKKFSTYYCLFKIELYTATQEDEQQDSIDKEIKAVIKGKNLSVKTEKNNFLN